MHAHVRQDTALFIMAITGNNPNLHQKVYSQKYDISIEVPDHEAMKSKELQLHTIGINLTNMI